MWSKNIDTFLECDKNPHYATTMLFGAPFDSTTSYRPGTRFGPDAMQVETGAGGRFEVPYRGLTGPYRTAHGIFLYDPAANVARVFPRAALTPESEAALWALLCRKTGREV